MSIFRKRSLILMVIITALVTGCAAPTPTPALPTDPPVPKVPPTVQSTDTTEPVPTQTPGPTPSVTPAPLTITYLASDEVILNPERGFFTPVDLTVPSDIFDYRAAMGATLVHTTVRLDDYREQDISQDFLDLLDSRFADLRSAGVKLVLRFAYNNGPYPNSEPDATKAWVLRHIQQLTPLLRKNADVIAFVEAGFVGAWGEWHSSTNGLDNATEKRDILFALLDALPASRMVQVRYPYDIIRIFPEPLTADKAFDGSYQARTGFHNDCFLSSDTDVGTYQRMETNTIVTDQAYLSEMTRFTPTGGETCAPNPPRSNCETALREMALLHFTEINLSFHQRIIKAWQKQGCFVEMQKRLGYRLVLEEASVTPNAKPGGELTLHVTLRNDGFASLINPRPLFVVLDGPRRYQVELPIDPRRWEAGKTAEFTARLRLPSAAPEGIYRLALWLPDAAETLRENPLYAVQFANQDTWEEETGWNILTDTFSVDPDVEGSVEEGTEMRVVEVKSEVH